jgi:anthranilate synthase component 1
MREYLADSLSPLAVYRRLATLSPRRFLFESVTGGEQVSRFSFLGVAPRQVYRLYEDRLEVAEGEGPSRPVAGEPLAALRQVLSQVEAEPGPIPFTGGFVGFFGFDLIRLVERLPHRPPDRYGLPVAVLARFDTLVAFDHARQRVIAVANEVEGEVSAAEAQRQLDRLEAVLTTAGGEGAVALPAEPPNPPEGAEASLSGADYRAAVETAKEHIRAGDIFQVVLARRFRLPRRVDPLALYRAVRIVNPSPYMVLLEAPEVSLVGASPEMLVRLRAGRLDTRPIAGTRRRGADAAEDRALAAELAADPKERAEHVMLVDLGRNDLGRVAAPGTVELASYMEVERYSHVMHLVSSVTAQLDPRRRARSASAGAAAALDALLACFPAGTVSGAPKIRAMEIIDQLEPEARGPYAGAVGYLSYSGDLDTCITIRTLVVEDDATSVTAGAGIVADSDPAAEERETESKAAALLAAVALAEELERREDARRRTDLVDGSVAEEAIEVGAP